MSKASHYYQILLRNVDSELEDAISGLCFIHEAAGVAENIDFKQMSRDYTPELIAKEKIDLQVFFETAPKKEFFEDLALRFSSVSVEFSEQENKDWMEEWKKGFESFNLAEDYWVVPSWLKPPEEANKIIWIDPGMAFGTGTHETTQLASSMILRRTDLFQGIESCLDVGTGTGILAILVNNEYTKNVFTTEIDDDARVVARENFAKNNCPNVELPDYQIQEIQKSFDLVIANIIDGVLIDLKEDLIERTKVGSYLILTGILEEREENFHRQFFNSANLEIVERKQKNEWVGFLAKRLK